MAAAIGWQHAAAIERNIRQDLLLDYMIDSYKFGRIIIEGEEYTTDLILTPTKIIRNWQKEEGLLLKASDLKQAMKELSEQSEGKLGTPVTKAPKVLIIGIGFEGCMKLDSSVEYICSKNNVTLIVQKTKEAVATFNSMKAPGVVAALNLTC